MELIGATLKPSDSGADVVNLISCLLVLVERGMIKTFDAPGRPTPDELRQLCIDAQLDAARRFYGGSVQRLVWDFQIQQGLGGDLGGVVDKKTATRLNEVLRILGVDLDPQAYEVFGLVLDATGRHPPTLDIRAYDRDYHRESVLGQASTDEAGRYRITFPASLHRKTSHEKGGPELFVRAFDAQGLLMAQSRTVSDAGHSTELNLTVSDDLRAVGGTVTDETCGPLPGLQVRAFDRDLRQEELLGQAVTDVQGRYQIVYATAQFRRAEKAAADLRVRVLSADGQTELTASATLFNATSRAQVDLTVPTSKLNIDSEWERYGRELAPLLGFSDVPGARQGPGKAVLPLPPHELTDDDLTFLHGETGLPLDRLRAIRQSAQWWQQHRNIKAFVAEGCYGLLRQGLPADWMRLLRAGPVRWRAALKASLAERIVTADLSSQVDAFIAALTELAVDSSFVASDPARPETVPGIGALIAASGLPAAQQRLVVQALLDQDRRDDPVALTATLQGVGLKDETIRPVRFALESFPLLQQHLPTLVALQRGIGKGYGAAVDLAEVQRIQWLALARQLDSAKALPAGFNSAAGYAASLADGVEWRYPTQVVAHALRQDPVPLRRAIGQLLLAQPAFDLLTGDPLDFVNKSDLSAVNAPRDAVVKQMQAEVRLARMAPPSQRAVAMSAMLKEGLDSALKVSRAGAVSVRRKLLPAIGKVATDHVIAQADARLADATLHLNRLGDVLSPPYMPHLPRLTGGADLLPTWARLFGGEGACPCRQCESVHGPAAYLADLLHFLSRMDASRDDGITRSLLEVLTGERRADLLQLELDCANAETPLPYIDLVIEHLERVLMPGLPVAQTPAHRPAEWLRAVPEQAPEAAALYGRTGPLMTARYPWQLPFDREQRLASVHLGLAGASPADVFQHLGGSEIATAQARLGMNAAAWDLLHMRVDRSAASVAEAWGVIGGLAGLLSVPTLLEQASMTWSELRDLVASPPFAPLRLDLDLGERPCDVSGHRLKQRAESGALAELTGEAQVATFDLLHRTLRLGLVMGASLETTLRILEALGVQAAAPASGTPDSAAIDLVSVARMAEMARRLGVDIQTLADRTRALADIDALARQQSLASWASLLGGTPVDLVSLADLGATMSLELVTSGTQRLLHLESAHAALVLLREAGIEPSELRFLLRGLDMVPALFSPLQADVDTHLDRIVALLHYTPAPAASEPDPRPGVVTDQLTAITGSPLTPALVSLLSATAAISTGDVTQDFLTCAADPAFRSQAERSLRRMMAASRLVALLKLDAQDLRALATVERDNTYWLDFDSLVPPPDAVPPYPAPPWAVFQRLLLVSRMQATLPANTDRLLPLLTRAADMAEIDAATGWGLLVGNSGSESAATLMQVFLSLRDDTGRACVWGRVEALGRLQQATRWLQGRRLGAVDASLLRSAVDGDASQAELLEFSRARFSSEAAWLAALAPAMDRLRGEQRDALLAHVLHTSAADFPSAKALYDHLLIDVEMGACQLSSRIVQAHGAIQLFVQRCLLKLESAVSLGDVSDIQDWKQWAWMKHYRVWEAGRKIFLYPENWIEPDLRVGKSPFFEAFESELLQDEIKTETVERAVRNYLMQLHDVARLDIRALYEELNEEPLADGTKVTRRVLHVVGRTHGIPHAHYYRRREDDLSWSAWEKIDLSIDADHLALAVQNRRPMLFWPQWQELEIAREGGAKAAVWDMHLNHSTLEFGRWSAQRASMGSMRFPRSPDDARPGIALRPRMTDGGLVEVLVYRYLSSVLAVVRPARGFMVAVTSFVVDPCTGAVQVETLPQATIRHLPADVVGFEQGLLEPADPVNDAASPTSLRNGPRDEPERYASSGVVGYSELLRTGGLGGVLVAAFMAADAALVEEVQSTLDDPASSMRLFDGMVDGYRLVPAQQYAQWNDEQPYVWQHAGRQLLAVRRLPGFRVTRGKTTFWTTPTYLLEAGNHPYACDLLESLRAEGIEGVYRPAEGMAADGSALALRAKRHPRQSTVGPDWVREELLPNFRAVSQPYPRDRFEFASSAAYGLYNWEVFFHIPLLVADRLSKSQQYEEAQRWLHSLFDPTDISPQPAPQKFWRVKPLFEEARRWPEAGAESLEALMRRLSEDASEVAEQVRRWRSDPFNPHLIASVRVLAYMKAVVQKYVQNLLNWGDSLFQRDTMESLNEATQIYELAAHILGSEPAQIDLPHRPARTYSELAALGTIDEFSNVLVDLETALPVAPVPGRPGERPAARLTSLYFCIPPNVRLATLRATVADRLFKIRHCMDLEGRTRQLALFAPPIDPALLVRARAAGMDIGRAIEQALAPAASPYRFSFLLGKALELANEVRAFGTAVLAALEKRDGEQLAKVRSRHDVQLQRLALQTREKQLDEAQAQLDAAMSGRAVSVLRRDHYQSLLSAGWSPSENAQIVNLHVAHGFEMTSGALRTVAGVMHLLPETKAGVTPAIIWGGPNIGRALDSTASSLSLAAQQFTFEASMAGYNATYERRAQDWQHQVAHANREIAQVDRQIAAAEIRVQIAREELNALQQQIAHSQEVDDYLRDKFTNTQLYGWMSDQLADMHYQSYRMAFDLARQAEAGAERELGPDAAARVRLDAWDSGRKGLLAGERLAQDLRRLELSYMHRNQRRLEITTNVSLRRLAPEALWRLRTTGSTGEFALPPWLFDMDFPGQTHRRIKSVSVSVPGVVGPYGGVNGMLRCEPTGYAGLSAIATSTGQNDAGVFQLDFRDERYLPFEGVELSDPGGMSGAAWEPALWTFGLSGLASFDHDTISDLVLHVQYVALPADGTGVEALAAVSTLLHDSVQTPLAILLSPRHDFPLEYRRLVEGGSDVTVVLRLDDRLFPYFARRRTITDVIQLTRGAPPPTRTFQGFSVRDATIELAQSDATSELLIRYALA